MIALLPKDTAAIGAHTTATDLQHVVLNGLLIQVTTFGIIAIVVKTKSRLIAMGFPLQAGSITWTAKRYQVILIGPFVDSD